MIHVRGHFRTQRTVIVDEYHQRQAMAHSRLELHKMKAKRAVPSDQADRVFTALRQLNADRLRKAAAQVRIVRAVDEIGAALFEERVLIENRKPPVQHDRGLVWHSLPGLDHHARGMQLSAIRNGRYRGRQLLGLPLLPLAQPGIQRSARQRIDKLLQAQFQITHHRQINRTVPPDRNKIRIQRNHLTLPPIGRKGAQAAVVGILWKAGAYDQHKIRLSNGLLPSLALEQNRLRVARCDDAATSKRGQHRGLGLCRADEVIRPLATQRAVAGHHQLATGKFCLDQQRRHQRYAHAVCGGHGQHGEQLIPRAIQGVRSIHPHRIKPLAPAVGTRALLQQRQLGQRLGSHRLVRTASAPGRGGFEQTGAAHRHHVLVH